MKANKDFGAQMKVRDMKSKTRFTHVDDVSFYKNTDIPGQDPRDQGVAKPLITEELTGAKDLRLGIGWLGPGEVHLLHHHPEASEFYYVVQGSAEVAVDDEIQQVRQGSAVYIPAGARHRIANNTDDTCVVLFGYNRAAYVSVWDE